MYVKVTKTKISKVDVVFFEYTYIKIRFHELRSLLLNKYNDFNGNFYSRVY